MCVMCEEIKAAGGPEAEEIKRMHALVEFVKITSKEVREESKRILLNRIDEFLAGKEGYEPMDKAMAMIIAAFEEGKISLEKASAYLMATAIGGNVDLN